MWAASRGRTSHIEKLWKLGVDLKERYKNYDVVTYAAYGGHLDTIKFLHEIVKIPLDGAINFVSPLTEACNSGKLDCVKYFIENNVNCIGPNGIQKTPFFNT